MSNYTGPVTLIPIIGHRDRFFHMLHVNVDDTEAQKKIFARYEEDGYKVDLTHKRSEYMVNGSLVEPGERDWQPRGYATRSAHLK